MKAVSPNWINQRPYLSDLESYGCFDSLRSLCADDIAKLCKDAKPGGGRIVKCLKQNEKDLSAEWREDSAVPGEVDAGTKKSPVKNPVLPHGASSKEKAILTIHPRSSERGILAFSRKDPYPRARAILS